MENIRFLVLMWGVALFLLAGGVYIMTRKRPVRLWTTDRVSEDQVTDVVAYNRAVGRMWCVTSIPVWIAGLVMLWYPAVSIVFFCLVCTVGIGCLVWRYHKIEETYFIKSKTSRE